VVSEPVKNETVNKYSKPIPADNFNKYKSKHNTDINISLLSCFNSYHEFQDVNIRLMFRIITDEQAYALNTVEQQTRNSM
jgi:hypothetical protein